MSVPAPGGEDRWPGPAESAAAPRPRGRALAAFLLAASVLAAGALVVPGTGAAQDTVRVDADGPGRWGDTLVAVEELRIGSLTGAEHETFGMITDLAVAEDGTIWVADVQVPIVSRFDARGRYLGTVGREGEGPGEYRQPIGLETLSDGTLALWDYGNRRITLYGPEGTFHDGHRVHTGTVTSQRMFYTDTASHFYVRTSLPSSVPQSQGLIQLSAEGAVVDTVRFPDRGDRGGPTAFGRRTLSTWSPYRELVVGQNSDYSFTVHRADGTSVTVVRSAESLPVKAEEREWWQARYEQWRRRVGDPGPDARAPISETKPVFKGLAADEEGRTWVHRYVEAEGFEQATDEDGSEETDVIWRERPTFDVYERNGAFLGTVVFPYRVRWVASRGRTVWAIQRGEFDESYVVRFTLSEGR